MAKKTRKHRLPPDPERKNDERAWWSEIALTAFQAATGADDGDAISDLLADLGHYCDRKGINLVDELRRGYFHYDEETSCKGKQFAFLGDVTIPESK
jgi:hypothetical protein